MLCNPQKTYRPHRPHRPQPYNRLGAIAAVAAAPPITADPLGWLGEEDPATIARRRVPARVLVRKLLRSFLTPSDHMLGERLEGLAQDDQANPFRLPVAEILARVVALRSAAQENAVHGFNKFGSSS